MSTAADPTSTAAIATRQRWETRYAEGVTPWDTRVTPPEVQEFWRSARLIPAGWALDLGCGPGTNVRYLAERGLQALGVEIAGAPLLAGLTRLRSAALDVRRRSHFLCADVSALPFAGLGAAYILDVGCFHSLPAALRPGYAAGIKANLRPGGYYHLYAFDELNEPAGSSGPHGVANREIAHLLSPELVLIEERRASPDRRPCRWYLLQRPHSTS